MHFERKCLESHTADGDSPVRVAMHFIGVILSSAGHVKSCVNPPGPSGKAKYS